jgi:hypothetical protein
MPEANRLRNLNSVVIDKKTFDRLSSGDEADGPLLIACINLQGIYFFCWSGLIGALLCLKRKAKGHCR